MLALVPLLQKSLEQEKSFEAAWALGNAYMETGDYAQAQGAFRSGLEMTSAAHPKARAEFKIGMALEKQGHLLQAEEYLKASLVYEASPEVEKELARVELEQARTVLPAAEIAKAFLVSRSFIAEEVPQQPEAPVTAARIELR
jgi:tetratricopeptide (TPR) repeat protein